MKEYKLITNGYSATDFQDKINKLLKEGWELHGRTFTTGQYNNVFCQAMIRTLKKRKNN